MYQQQHAYLLFCEEPLHAGAGNEAAFADIDKPIQRNKSNHLPMIEGSSFRGAVRDSCERRIRHNPGALIKKALGNDPEDTEQKRGAVRFGTLDLLLLPVAAPLGVQAFVTCPMVLENWAYQAEMLGFNLTIEGIPTGISSSKACFADDSLLKSSAADKVTLLQETFTKHHNLRDIKINTVPINDWFAAHLPLSSRPSMKECVQKNLVIVHNDIFKILAHMHTYVPTGVRINPKTGVVDQGKLFKTEYLPQWSVLSGWMYVSPEFPSEKESEDEKKMEDAQTIGKAIRKAIDEDLHRLIQVGGRSSIGKGIGRMTWIIEETTPKTTDTNENPAA